MSWWSWAIVGYFGLVVVLLAALVSVSSLLELRSRLVCRRMVRDAERFLAEAALSIRSSSGSR